MFGSGKMKSGNGEFVMAAGKKAGNLPKKSGTMGKKHTAKHVKGDHEGGKPRPRKP